MINSDEIQELKKLLADGRRVDYHPKYSEYYTKITGKKRLGRCTGCETTWLFVFLSRYIKENKL